MPIKPLKNDAQEHKASCKPTSSDTSGNSPIDRRDFLIRSSAAAAVATAAASGAGAAWGASLIDTSATGAASLTPETTAFAQADSMFFGHQWQSLNPGAWEIRDHEMRRRMKNYGDRARHTGFPFHGATHNFEYQTDYDPSLPAVIAYRPDRYLETSYSIEANFTFHAPRPDLQDGDSDAWKMYTDGFGVMGIAIGGKHLHESFHDIKQAVMIAWTDDGRLSMVMPPKKDPVNGQRTVLPETPTTSGPAVVLQPGDRVNLKVVVLRKLGDASGKANVTATMTVNGDSEASAVMKQTLDAKHVSGFAGVAARGQIDFGVSQFTIAAANEQTSVNADANSSKIPVRKIGVCDCLNCYPLGDSLKEVDGKWHVKFVAMFASAGETVQIRIADNENPEGGWNAVPVAGTAQIVDNDFRRFTAIVHAVLPTNPADTEMFYTVHKDGVDVTADGRVGSDACGKGTGLVGDVPGGGGYVGRLPHLVAPYKVCGLSCHAVSQGLQRRVDGQWKMQQDGWQIRDQPTEGAYAHLDEYNFQVMLWEDDVWYMELVMYPPSTDDAYKIVALSICGPTSRWQMMRHWNVINPGDHDFGMDDVKGPEQIAMRNVEGLGQDRDYMRRNFQIVHHLVTGAETVDPTVNMKTWRSWKMPNRDFTLIVLDSRSWRSSQDVDMWDDAGWGKFKSLYDRTDPTRSMLGEEQFGWLQETLATDSSPLICLTGISGMHTVWTGAKYGKSISKFHPMNFDQRDRVTADYAGWVKAGADRVLELLGAREGVVSVYGDVHNGCIMRNVDQRVIECSFGPIGRTGGRGCIPGFGPKMKDVDGREVEVMSLYHGEFKTPSLEPHGDGDPVYWNFLELEFDPRKSDPMIAARVRNLVDAPDQMARGGGELATVASATGRVPQSVFPATTTLPNADVRLTDIDGQPIRATRSDRDGNVQLKGLPDIAADTSIVMTAYDGNRVESKIVKTVAG